nr:hypothetical protein [Tanacetum cinerariifolium]
MGLRANAHGEVETRCRYCSGACSCTGRGVGGGHRMDLKVKVAELICNEMWRWLRGWSGRFVEIAQVQVPKVHDNLEEKFVWINKRGKEKNFSERNIILFRNAGRSEKELFRSFLSLLVKYDAYNINGCTFRMKCHDGKVYQNNRVSVEAIDLHISKEVATTRQAFYYGFLQEIWVLDYHFRKMSLFKCDWVNHRAGGVKRDTSLRNLVMQSYVEIKNNEEIERFSKESKDADKFCYDAVEVKEKTLSGFINKENEHLKLVYKNLFDSIKKPRVQKEKLRSTLSEFATDHILGKDDSSSSSVAESNTFELEKKSGKNIYENEKYDLQTKIDELEKVACLLKVAIAMSSSSDQNREVFGPETFHEQSDDELTEAEIKQMEADDQVIQIILLGLPEDIYVAVDSCETAQEIWLRVQQMMKGSDIGIQERKAKGLGHLARNCTVRPRRRDAAYLQTQLLIAQKEEVGIHLQAEEFYLMAAATNLNEIEKVNANCILMTNLQQTSTSRTYSDKAPIYDSDGSPKNDSNVIFTVSSMEQVKGTIEQHSGTVEEICVYHESLFHNLAAGVEKVNSVNRVQNFKIQLLKEATKFVQDFKSFAKEADESLAKHKALELEIERLLKEVVSQDIMSIV